MAVEFHPLTIADVKAETDDSVSITFDVPESLRAEFRHLPGQHVVVRAELDGDDVRRSYSICSPPGDPSLRIGVKRIPDGAFSTFATTRLAAGDVVDVMAPIGEFIASCDPAAARRSVMIAAGSGITPILSMITTVLRDEPASEVTLVYGNRTSRSIMFLEELEALKNRYPDRFQVVHILSREPHQVPLFEGRVDAEKLRSLTSTLIDPGLVDDWYLCGPLDMIETITTELAELGVGPEAIHYELFYDQRIETVPDVTVPAAGLTEVTLTLDGRTSVVQVDPGGPPLLDYARTVRPEVPFACKGGMCATCKAVVIDGDVTMAKNYALTDGEVAAGFVLTCQAHPTGDRPVAISYDVHGGIGR